MSIITVLFIAWVALYIYRGYKKGLWPMVLGLIGFIGAYAAAILWASDFAALLQTMGLGSVAAMITAVLVLFFGASFLLSTLPQFVFAAKFREENFKLPWFGAGVGALVGVVSGLILIWGYSLIKSTVIDKPESPAALSNTASPSAEMTSDALEKEKEVLPELASKVVGKVASAGISAMGTENMQTKAMGAMLQQPEEFVGGLKSLSRSPELREFINDKNVQYLMATNDVGSLMQTDSYKKLRDQQGMDQLIDMVEPAGEGQGSEQMDRLVAEKMTFVWRRMQYMKNDPRVQEILRDPEVHNLIQQQNPAALLVNPKVHKLIGIIMQDQPEMENFDFTQFIGTEIAPQVERENTPGMAERESDGEFTEREYVAPAPREPDVIYKWYDDSGTVRYTDKKNVPSDKLDSAELMTR